MDLPDWARGKILTVDEARDAFHQPDQSRLPGAGLVWTNGCFDIIHAAHVDLFRQAARLGILIVGVNTDDSVFRFKGRRPVNAAMDRALVVLGIKGVECVVIFDEIDPSVAIEAIQPEIVVKGSGGGYDLEAMPEYLVGIAYGGRFVEIMTDQSYSTTKLIERIQRGEQT